MSVLDWLYVLTVAPAVLAVVLVALIIAAIVTRHRERKAHIAEHIRNLVRESIPDDDVPIPGVLLDDLDGLPPTHIRPTWRHR